MMNFPIPSNPRFFFNKMFVFPPQITFYGEVTCTIITKDYADGILKKKAQLKMQTSCHVFFYCINQVVATGL